MSTAPIWEEAQLCVLVGATCDDAVEIDTSDWRLTFV